MLATVEFRIFYLNMSYQQIDG